MPSAQSVYKGLKLYHVNIFPNFLGDIEPDSPEVRECMMRFHRDEERFCETFMLNHLRKRADIGKAKTKAVKAIGANIGSEEYGSEFRKIGERFQSKLNFAMSESKYWEEMLENLELIHNQYALRD